MEVGLSTKEPSTAQSGRKVFARIPGMGVSVAAGRARIEVMAKANARRREHIMFAGLVWLRWELAIIYEPKIS